MIIAVYFIISAVIGIALAIWCAINDDVIWWPSLIVCAMIWPVVVIQLIRWTIQDLMN